MFLVNPLGSGLAPDAPKPEDQRPPVGLKAMTAVRPLFGEEPQRVHRTSSDALKPERADLWL